MGARRGLQASHNYYVDGRKYSPVGAVIHSTVVTAMNAPLDALVYATHPRSSYALWRYDQPFAHWWLRHEFDRARHQHTVTRENIAVFALKKAFKKL